MGQASKNERRLWMKHDFTIEQSQEIFLSIFNRLFTSPPHFLVSLWRRDKVSCLEWRWGRRYRDLRRMETIWNSHCEQRKRAYYGNCGGNLLVLRHHWCQRPWYCVHDTLPAHVNFFLHVIQQPWCRNRERKQKTNPHWDFVRRSQPRYRELRSGRTNGQWNSG